MFLTKNNDHLVLFYSVILILSSETLILRLSPNLFPILCSIPLIFAGQIVSKKNKDKSGQKYFYWSEGSVSIGRVGDSSTFVT